MEPINRQDAKGTSFTWMDWIGWIRQSLCTSAISAVKRLAVWIKRRFCRVTEPTPEKLINDIANRYGLAVYIVPPDVTEAEMVARSVIFFIAEHSGLCVILACPKKNLKETPQRKVSTAGRN